MTDIDIFREKLALNSAAFDTVHKNVRTGWTENEVKNLIRRTWNEKAGRDVPYSGDIVSGGRSATIEGDATDRVLENGDVMILDLQPGFDNCFADTTRTFFIGGISKEAEKVYSALLFALSECEKLLRPGTRANEIYFCMQDALKKHGYTCPHHAGHAVGEEKLMEPELLPDRTAPLEEGMIIAVEPGVYTEEFGIRIENNYLITKDGCKNLFDCPLDAKHFILGVKK